MPDDALAPFFAAARDRTPTLPPHRLAAILDDAARVQAERATRPPARRGMPGRLLDWLVAPGRLGPAAALAGCAAVGFAAGLAGGGELGSAWLWPAQVDVEGAVPAVEAFFDLAAAEG